MLLRLRRILYWIGLVIGGGLFIMQIVVGIQPLLANQQAIYTTAFLGVALAGMIFLIWLQMLNWGKILEGTGFGIGLKEITKGYTLSFLPRYIPGSIWGYLSRGEWLHQRFQVPYPAVNLSSILDIFVTVVSAIMVIGLFSNDHNNANGVYFLKTVLFVIALPLLIWLLFERLIKLSRFAKNLWFRRLAPDRNIPLFTWLQCILIFLIQWVVLGAVILSIMIAFFPDAEAQRFFNLWSLAVTTFAFSLAWLVGFLIVFIPGGVGIREVVLTSVLLSFFPVSIYQAMIVAVLSRFLYSFAELFWIAVGFVLSRSS